MNVLKQQNVSLFMMMETLFDSIMLLLVLRFGVALVAVFHLAHARTKQVWLIPKQNKNCVPIEIAL